MGKDNRDGGEKSFENKKELVQTYLIITTLLITIIKENIPTIWILAFITAILGYSALLMYEKDGQDIFAMFTGISFSVIIFYSTVVDFINADKIDYPLSTYLFKTPNSSIITGAVNDSPTYGFMLTAVAMLLLGLIAALTTCTLSMDKKKNLVSPLKILKNAIDRTIPKKNNLLFISLIFISILLLFYKAKVTGVTGIYAYALGFLGVDIPFGIHFREIIWGYDLSNIRRN